MITSNKTTFIIILSNFVACVRYALLRSIKEEADKEIAQFKKLKEEEYLRELEKVNF
jgi:hypothetical protein